MTAGRKSAPGFTFIEVLVGMLITGIAAAAMLYGITYARAQIRQVVIQERALDELSSYVEYWIGRLHDNNVTQHEMAGDNRGQEVILYSPIGDPDLAVKGKLYREEIQKEYSYLNPGLSPYYTLTCYLRWRDPVVSEDEEQELRLTTKVIPFR